MDWQNSFHEVQQRCFLVRPDPFQRLFPDGVVATLGTFFHSASTAGGSLSICLRNIAIFQISSSCSVVVKLGIAVKRIPCFTFQNEAVSGSSSTPSFANCGASI